MGGGLKGYEGFFSRIKHLREGGVVGLLRWGCNGGVT